MLNRRHFFTSSISTFASMMLSRTTQAGQSFNEELFQNIQNITSEVNELENVALTTRIKIIGVGDGGSNIVENIILTGLQGVEFFCVNSAHSGRQSKFCKTLPIGIAGLCGGGTRSEIYRDYAELEHNEIREILQETDFLFIIAGMGGCTGGGVAPVIARIAQDCGIFIVGVIIKPFKFEGRRWMSHADAVSNKLETTANSVITVLNEKLLIDADDDISQEMAFELSDNLISNTVSGIANVINVPNSMSLDFKMFAALWVSQASLCWVRDWVLGLTVRASHLSWPLHLSYFRKQTCRVLNVC